MRPANPLPLGYDGEHGQQRIEAPQTMANVLGDCVGAAVDHLSAERRAGGGSRRTWICSRKVIRRVLFASFHLLRGSGGR